MYFSCNPGLKTLAYMILVPAYFLLNFLFFLLLHNLETNEQESE